ncbi:MAG: hypothetical protein AB7V19_08080 [Candidatus Bipolaricaulia bacterium]
MQRRGGLRSHTLEASLGLPFNCNAAPIATSGTVPGDHCETRIELQYCDSVSLMPGTSHAFDVSHCTLVSVRRELLRELPEDEVRAWVADNYSRVMNEHILPALNHFLMHLRLAHPSPMGASVVHPVGEIDLLFASLVVDEEPVGARVTQTFLTAFNRPPRYQIVAIDISEPLPNEFLLLTRAVGLADRGYCREALVIGVALVDEAVQTFLAKRLPNLDPAEGADLLRAIERSRLMTFLTAVLKMATGSSLLMRRELHGEIKWLNEKRNRIMHHGDSCSLKEAQRGLKAVLGLLQFLNELGAEYRLPPEVRFWSR